MLSPQEMASTKRYEEDTSYRMLVDTLYMQIERSHYTPQELRDAVLLACTRYEMLNVRPTFIEFWRYRPWPIGPICPNCGVGIDSDGDGNCAHCAPKGEKK